MAGNETNQRRKKSVNNDDLKGDDNGQDLNGGQAPAEGQRAKPQGAGRKPVTVRDSTQKDSTQNKVKSRLDMPQDSVKKDTSDHVIPKQNVKPDSVPAKTPAGAKPNKQDGGVSNKKKLKQIYIYSDKGSDTSFAYAVTRRSKSSFFCQVYYFDVSIFNYFNNVLKMS
jgi:hypothetical protein